MSKRVIARNERARKNIQKKMLSEKELEIYNCQKEGKDGEGKT